MLRLNKGTIEYIVVDVVDRLDTLTDLDTATPTFTTRVKDVEPPDYRDLDGSVVTDGMRAMCLIDTASYEEGMYELYIDFSNAPEIPRLGPYDFKVID